MRTSDWEARLARHEARYLGESEDLAERQELARLRWIVTWDPNERRRQRARNLQYCVEARRAWRTSSEAISWSAVCAGCSKPFRDHPALPFGLAEIEQRLGYLERQ